MDQARVYQWAETIHNHLPLGKWQSVIVAGFSLGIIEGEHCHLSRVAERLAFWGKADTVERRLQRYLNNGRVEIEACQAAWMVWVWQTARVPGERLYLLVDETKLSGNLSVMVVGLAYERRCIGLVWRSYHPTAWPCGQVALIEGLLQRVKAVLPAGVEVIVEADRGIGTSPDLIRAVQKLGWDYLFRVQGTVRFYNDDQPECEVRTLTTRGGKSFSASGSAFKDAGWLEVEVRVIWSATYDDPWCLVSNRADLTGWEYAQRNWQEQSFRDLKSGGWQWNHSHVWLPSHADRLLLVLWLAYALALSLGGWAHQDRALYREATKGSRCRYSRFRLGLRVWAAFRRLAAPLRCFLDLRPLPPLVKGKGYVF
jgi:predicted small integral membrane protein